MRRLGYIYEVKVEVEFTREEIDLMVRRALEHYDATCRAAAIPGPGAFLNALKVSPSDAVDDSGNASWRLTIRNLDLLGKILEPWHDDPEQDLVASLGARVLEELKAAVAERERVNGSEGG